MIKRSAKASSFGGAFVFPGGVLEPGDLQQAALQRVTGMTQIEANRRLKVEAGGLAYWIAAVRECFEETGILLALDEHGRRPGTRRMAQMSSQREALNSGQLAFGDFLEQESLWLPATSLGYFAHWITPAVQERRFDTRFFVALAPEGQEAVHDDSEIVECLWLTPGEVLDRVRRHEMTLLFATQQIVSEIGRFAAPHDVLANAHSAAEVEVNRPCLATGQDGPRLFGLGDAPYAEIHWADPQETGGFSYDLQAGVPKRLDRYVIRLIAPNAGILTGPGTNTYLVGGQEVAVIDPGPNDPSHIEAILAAGSGRIRWIILTHTHSDHAAAVAVLKQATGAVVVGRHADFKGREDETVAIERILSDGDAIEFDGLVLSAVHTPGHASNHLCYLLDKTRMLFTGDHIMQGSTVVISPPDGNLRAYLLSLQRLLAVPIGILAPGHGYLIGRPHAEVDRLIRHRLAREGKVLRAVSAAREGIDLEALVARVYDDVPVNLHALAAHSLRAHLEKLVEDGDLRCNNGCYALA